MTAPPPTIEHPALTRGIQSRDPDILREVVRQHLPALLRAARGAGLPLEQAEGTVQEVFLTALARAEDFHGRARVRNWLNGILLKKLSRAFEHLRRAGETADINQVVEARLTEDGRWARPPGGPGVGGDRERIRAWLGECLEDLPERRRLAFVLREVEEHSTEEVCRVPEVSPNNLGVLLFRARNGLRECLDARGLGGRHDADV